MKEVTIKTNNPQRNKLYDKKTITYNEMKTHRENVYKVMNEIAWYINETGTLHDWTKETFYEDYYQDTIEREYETDYNNREWYKIHTKYERHHIPSNPPVDINLIDIIEMIVDCIVTPIQNNTSINYDYLKLDETLLKEAYWNTITLIEDNIITDTTNTETPRQEKK